jgi:hypothetical protein
MQKNSAAMTTGGSNKFFVFITCLFLVLYMTAQRPEIKFGLQGGVAVILEDQSQYQKKS